MNSKWNAQLGPARNLTLKEVANGTIKKPFDQALAAVMRKASGLFCGLPPAHLNPENRFRAPAGSTSTSMVTTVVASAPPTKPAGPRWWPN